MKHDRLDTTDFETLFQNALQEWKEKSGNDVVYESDVSYTLIEMMAMLEDMLNFYMEHISDQHIKQYEALLKELKKDPQVFYACLLSEQDKRLKKGQVWHMKGDQGALPLELIQGMHTYHGRFLAIYYNDRYSTQRLDTLFSLEQGSFALPIKHDEAQLMFLLDHPFTKNEVYSMYIDCDSADRGPQAGENPQFANWCFSNYGEDGWTTIEILRDDTWNFLYSGMIYFRISESMKHFSYENKSGYVMKCELKQDCYDALPIIKGIWLSMAEMLPQEHLTRSYEIYMDGAHSEYEIEEDVQEYTSVEVLKEDQNEKGFYEKTEYQMEKRDEKTAIHLSLRQEESVHIRIIFFKTLPYPSICSGVTMQQISLKNCSVEGLLVQEGNGYRQYSCYQRNQQVPYGYGCWFQDGILTFGNGRDFRIAPRKGHILYENLIYHEKDVLYGLKEPQIIDDFEVQLPFPMIEQKEEKDLFSSYITSCDTICTASDINEHLQRIPAISIKKMKICKSRQFHGWKIYVHTKTGNHPDWYLRHIQNHLGENLLLGLKTEAAWMHIVSVKIRIYVSQRWNTYDELLHKLTEILNDEDVAELSCFYMETICRTYIKTPVKIQVQMLVNEMPMKQYKLKEEEGIELKELMVEETVREEV